MADRICPSCGAAADPRLKFCRECGARIEDAAAGGPPPAPPEDSGDRTQVSAGPRAPAAPPPGPAGDGDETLIGALPKKGKPAPAGKDPTGGSTVAVEPEEQKTVFAGAAVPEAEPPTDTVPEGSGDETIISGGPRAAARAAAPAAVPPPPPPPPAPAPPARIEIEEPEPEPVTDDFDSGDDESGSTIAQAGAAPAAAAGAPPARPARSTGPTRLPEPSPGPEPAAGAPAVPAPAGSIRLEHWSPKVKSDVVTLAKAETLVGRDRGDLQYPEDNYLSKKHARFYRDPEGRLCVEDLGTLNGTFLRLRGPEKLEHRDVLYVGRHLFRFELLKYEEQDDRTIEGDPLTRVQGVQGTAPRARLVKRQDEGFRGLPFYFGTQRYVLGRSDGTHNFQRDDLMSRRHASLSFKDGDYWLEDMGSQNGTYLRIRGPRAMEPGDILKMGDQYFKLA
jgi:pSer/pThr/pTyr-binding forkhead associated (FHA) protein